MDSQVPTDRESMIARARSIAIKMANNGSLNNGLQILFNYLMQNSRGAMKDEHRYSEFARLTLSTLGNKFLNVENLDEKLDQDNKDLLMLLDACCVLLEVSPPLNFDFWKALDISHDWKPLEEFLEFCNNLLDKGRIQEQITNMESDSTTTWSARSSQTDKYQLLNDLQQEVKHLVAESRFFDPFSFLGSSDEASRNQSSVDKSSDVDTESVIESIPFDNEDLHEQINQSTSPTIFAQVSVCTSPIHIVDIESKTLMDQCCSVKPETVERYVHTDVQNETKDISTSPAPTIETKSEHIQTDLIDKTDSSVDATLIEAVTSEVSCSPMSNRKGTADGVVQTDFPTERKILHSNPMQKRPSGSFFFVEDLTAEDGEALLRKVRGYSEVC